MAVLQHTTARYINIPSNKFIKSHRQHNTRYIDPHQTW